MTVQVELSVECKDLREEADQRGLRDNMDHRVFREHRELVDHRETRDLQEIMAFLDLPEVLAPRVQLHQEKQEVLTHPRYHGHQLEQLFKSYRPYMSTQEILSIAR